MMRNNRLEIRTEAQKKSSSGRRKGGQRLRGMGVAQLEQHIRAEEEKKRAAEMLFFGSPGYHQVWGAGFPNGYDPRSHGFFYDHRSAYPFFNHTGTMEEFGSGNPGNGSASVKEYYEFFPDAKTDPVPKPLADCTPHDATSTIDLSLKL